MSERGVSSDVQSLTGVGLPAIGRPATRALLAEGLTTLADVAAFGEARLAALHGVGPKAIRVLSAELATHGLAWSDA